MNVFAHLKKHWTHACRALALKISSCKAWLTRCPAGVPEDQAERGQKVKLSVAQLSLIEWDAGSVEGFLFHQMSMLSPQAVRLVLERLVACQVLQTVLYSPKAPVQAAGPPSFLRCTHDMAPAKVPPFMKTNCTTPGPCLSTTKMCLTRPMLSLLWELSIWLLVGLMPCNVLQACSMVKLKSTECCGRAAEA